MTIETNFNKGYIEVEILAFLSGFGAKVMIMIKLNTLAIHSAEFDRVTNDGKVVLNKVVTILHAKAVFR
ncbi:hypothetical protein [Paenibacillus sp. FSL H8-0332]|uniref:hypothetical protein n=1 Tax=Paenibacillus sp. FSL H8-0332 TaxID=2954742 RepID=UPI0030D4C600